MKRPDKRNGMSRYFALCTNVKSKRRIEYEYIGTTLIEFFEIQSEIKDGDKICLIYAPDNQKMHELATRLQYNDAGSGSRWKKKGNGNGGTSNDETETECKKRSRASNPSSGSEGGSKDTGTKKSEHPDTPPRHTQTPRHPDTPHQKESENLAVCIVVNSHILWE